MYPLEIINKLIMHTPFDEKTIYNLFLKSYENIVFNDVNLNNPLSGILQLGIIHRKRFKYGLLCCPSCLKKNAYYKKEWRLFYSLACTDCSFELIDKCPKCNKPISFHRLETGNKNSILSLPISHCYHCLYDIGNHNSSIDNNSLIMKYQKFINNTINNGYNSICQYSFQYFHVLNWLSRKAHTKSLKWNRIRLAIENQYDIKFDPTFSLSNNLLERKKVLLSIYQILSDWPKEFFKTFNKKGIRYSDFSKDNNSIPYWLHKELITLN